MGFDGAEMMRLMARFRDSDATVEEVDGPGGRIRIRKHPAPGIAVQVEALGPGPPEIVVTGFEPGERRGPGYPDGMPFVPGIQVSMAGGPDSLRPSLTWWGVADPLGLAEALAGQLERDGWERSGTEEVAEPIMMRHMTLRRGFEERIILASGVAGTSVHLLVPRSGGVT